MPMKKVLIFIDWYLPGYKAGGPIKSCAQIVNHLSPFYEFKIVTRDTDINETIPYPGVPSDQWVQRQPNEIVMYLSSKQVGIATIWRIIKEEKADVVYINGLFSFFFSILPLFISVLLRTSATNLVVCPRGMLHKGALSIKSKRKHYYLLLLKLVQLPGKIVFHASGVAEQNEIRERFGSTTTIMLASNFPNEVDQQLTTINKQRDQAILVYLSRIHKIKNLLKTIRLLHQVRGQIKLEVYGNVEDLAYWNECQAEIAHLPSNVKVSYNGVASNVEVADAIRQAHFFILLTEGENFGHSIVEALSYGRPVIISNRTPWRNLPAQKAGWDCPLNDENSFALALNQALAMDQLVYDQWCTGALKYADNILSKTELILAYQNMFDRLPKRT